MTLKTLDFHIQEQKVIKKKSPTRFSKRKNTYQKLVKRLKVFFTITLKISLKYFRDTGKSLLTVEF